MATQMPTNKIELDETLKRQVEECAEANGVSPTEVVRDAVQEYLSTHGSNGGHAAPKPRRRLAEIADAVTADVPDEEWAKLPTDLAKNFEHYRYGYPRED